MRLIDADKLKKAFCSHCDGDEPCTEPCIDIGLIETAPTVDAVEVKHGEWMEEGTSCSYIFHCSVCGGVAYFVHGKGRGRNMERRFCGYRYCPNCGAKMDGEVMNDG